jgi:hypothetical protein
VEDRRELIPWLVEFCYLNLKVHQVPFHQYNSSFLD